VNHTRGFDDALAAILSRPTIGDLVDVKLVSSHAGGGGMLVWLEAELLASYKGHDQRLKSVPLRVTEALSVDAQGVAVVLAHVAVPTTKLSPRSKPLVEVGTKDPDSAALLASGKALEVAMSPYDAMVFGTEPDVHAFRPAAARRLVKQWRNLSMSIAGHVYVGGLGPAAWIVANVDLKRSGSTAPVRMRATFVSIGGEYDDVGTLVHYSIPAE